MSKFCLQRSRKTAAVFLNLIVNNFPLDKRVFKCYIIPNERQQDHHLPQGNCRTSHHGPRRINRIHTRTSLLHGRYLGLGLDKPSIKCYIIPMTDKELASMINSVITLAFLVIFVVGLIG